MTFAQVYTGLTAAALLGTAAPAAACIGPPPRVRLTDESEAAFLARSQAFAAAENDEDRRAFQVRLFDQASRVTLARVTASTKLPGALSDGLSPGFRVEVQPIALFKGPALNGRPVALQDAGMSTCGRYGGGTATATAPGSYILLFEDANPQGPTGHHGILLHEVREPRVLERFNAVVQQARAAAAAQ